jgi:HK97 family phage major capsid protein
VPNQLPSSGATQAAGGYLIPPQYADPFVQTILREQAVAQLARSMVLRGRQIVFTTYLGRPIAGFVGEGGMKPVTGASWGQVQVGIQELAAIVPFTNQVLDDAVNDPELLIGPDVEASIGGLVDAHAFGMQAGVGITSNFASNLAATTQTVEYDAARPDALAFAISQAMGRVEANGGQPDGVALTWTFRQAVREARLGATPGAAQPVYSQNFAGLDPFQGLRTAFTTNLSPLAATPGAGKVIAIVGDWSNAILLLRNDITVARSTEATIDNAGTLIHLWQQNMQALRYDVRVGFYANDLNRQFCAIVDAA